MTAWVRSACLIAALVAALYGCQAPPQPKAPEAAAAAPAPSLKLAPAPVVAQQPSTPAPAAETPRPAPKPRAPAKKRAPRPKPAPVVAQPAPPPPPPVQPNPEEERKRKLDAYLAAIGRSTIAFNPPSPVQVRQSSAVSLSMTPPAEAAALAEELRKSLADPAAWTPRVRARISGADFGITPAEGKDIDGVKDLPASGPVEWRWTVVPGMAGSKKLVAMLSVGLPPALGAQRDLPAIQREVVVEATLSWRIAQAWSDYWQWILAALAVVAAIAWWAIRR
jgi:hypothetical protein